MLAVFIIADKVRPESADAVKKLHDLGIEVAMMTGDSEDVARGPQSLRFSRCRWHAVMPGRR